MSPSTVAVSGTYSSGRRAWRTILPSRSASATDWRDPLPLISIPTTYPCVASNLPVVLVVPRGARDPETLPGLSGDESCGKFVWGTGCVDMLVTSVCLILCFYDPIQRIA